MVQFLPLGLQIPKDHPDRNRYLSLKFRHRAKSSDVAELTLMSPGDIFFLYSDGVYDGSDKEERQQLESVMREHYRQPAKEICNALLERSEEHTSELQSQSNLVCRLLLEKKKYDNAIVAGAVLRYSGALRL